MTLKKKIIQAATQSFNNNGAKFTLTDITILIGISKKTIYTEFKSKEDLIMAMITEGFHDIKVEEKKILKNPKLSITEKLEQIIVVQPKKFDNINFSQLITLKEKYPDLYKEIHVRIESDWEPTIELIEQGIEEGSIRKISIPVFKAMIEASIEHFLVNPAIQSCEIGYTKALNEMMAILMTGIKQEKE